MARQMDKVVTICPPYGQHKKGQARKSTTVSEGILDLFIPQYKVTRGPRATVRSPE